jgi:hypothetical protein
MAARTGTIQVGTPAACFNATVLAGRPSKAGLAGAFKGGASAGRLALVGGRRTIRDNIPAGLVSFFAPPGVTAVTVECWGAGSDGVFSDGSEEFGGGGGGGGAYATRDDPLTVAPGTAVPYAVSVRNGGTTTIFSAAPGVSAVAAPAGLSSKGGAAADCLGDTKFNGGDGGAGGTGGGGGGGGVASAAGAGNAAVAGGAVNGGAGGVAIAGGSAGGAGGNIGFSGSDAGFGSGGGGSGKVAAGVGGRAGDGLIQLVYDL